MWINPKFLQAQVLGHIKMLLDYLVLFTSLAFVLLHVDWLASGILLVLYVGVTVMTTVSEMVFIGPEEEDTDGEA